MNLKKQFKEGLFTNNPILVQQLGLCATMAITTSLCAKAVATAKSSTAMTVSRFIQNPSVS